MNCAKTTKANITIFGIRVDKCIGFFYYCFGFNNIDHKEYKNFRNCWFYAGRIFTKINCKKTTQAILLKFFILGGEIYRIHSKKFSNCDPSLTIKYKICVFNVFLRFLEIFLDFSRYIFWYCYHGNQNYIRKNPIP